jgi:rhodanese-related sulfurtransferase
MLERLVRLFRRAPATPAWIEPAVLANRLGGDDPPLVVDVRGADEFDGPLGHIEGARNIPLKELTGQMAELARTGRPLVMVCLTDMRSSAAATQLVAAGLRDIAVLRGGMKAWRENPR